MMPAAVEPLAPVTRASNSNAKHSQHLKVKKKKDIAKIMKFTFFNNAGQPNRLAPLPPATPQVIHKKKMNEFSPM